MRRIKSNVSYVVPTWNFCNSDITTNDSDLSKNLCSFCIKTKDGYRCALYDIKLETSNRLIEKTRACCKATAGFNSEIVKEYEKDSLPTVEPKVLMREAILSYNKTLSELLNQGYPRQLAEKLAIKHTIGD